MKKIVVAGGGIGGLTAAAFLAKEGLDVTVLEGSGEWGGCAGKFKRGPYLFPVGATLGMGFEPGGIHHILLEQLGLAVKARVLDEVMKITMPGRQITFYRDRQKHLEELCCHFPGAALQIASFLKEIWQIGEQVRKLVGDFPVLPPQTPPDFILLARSVKPGTVKLLPYLGKTLGDLVEKHGLQTERNFVHFLDAQIIDSMQTTSSSCSAIMGAFALDIYHEGAFYLQGGLYRIAEILKDYIAANGGKVHLRSKVTEIHQRGGLYEVMDAKKRQWKGDHVILNLPVQAVPTLLKGDLRTRLSKKHVEKSDISQWGAATLYLAVREKAIPENAPLFQQVISNDSGRMDEGEHVFISLSDQGDHLRAPEGFRTITVSTHTNLKYWEGKENYDRSKLEMEQKLLSTVSEVFPGVEKGIEVMVTGAPGAWERFTGRPQGMVGGFPQTLNNILFNSLSHRTGIKNLWICGDSVFPGAGTVGVSVSGFHTARSIIQKCGRSKRSGS